VLGYRDKGVPVKKLMPLIIALLGYAVYEWQGTDVPAPIRSSTSSAPATQATVTRETALRAGQQARGSGIVSRVLPDDNDGSRHQRFILELPSGRTLLVAHNIDVAPRIPSLQRGDTVEYYGVFETNDRGGVIHWTHHDPQGRHIDGWLQHNGRRYE